MSKESLSLDELQTYKAALETTARRLRVRLHKLRQGGVKGWETTFADVQAELVAVTGKIGALNRRICALVEGTIVTEEDDTDV